MAFTWASLALPGPLHAQNAVAGQPADPPPAAETSAAPKADSAKTPAPAPAPAAPVPTPAPAAAPVAAPTPPTPAATPAPAVAPVATTSQEPAPKPATAAEKKAAESSEEEDEFSIRKEKEKYLEKHTGEGKQDKDAFKLDFDPSDKPLTIGKEEGTPWYKHWLFWSLIGAAALIGVVVGVKYGTDQPKDTMDLSIGRRTP